jgi:hypothetical protein
MNQEYCVESQLNTAVLFLVFNRPDTTKRVFDAIRLVKPRRLYVSADGPRPSREGEVDLTRQVRKISTNVDWPCQVKTLFRRENLGCKKAVSSGIDWFFDQEKQGIILEDDCLPHQNFFYFCEKMLDFYHTNEDIFAITGDNFQKPKRRNGHSYYFSRYNHVWGWASWRRSWQKYDVDMLFWPEWRKSEEWELGIKNMHERKYWENVFNEVYIGNVDTWDYQWTASVWKNNGIVITPVVNLVENIGFGKDATHTKSKRTKYPTIEYAHEINCALIEHPKIIKIDSGADEYVFDTHFKGYSYKMPASLLYKPLRIIKRICKNLKIKFDSQLKRGFK